MLGGGPWLGGGREEEEGPEWPGVVGSQAVRKGPLRAHLGVPLPRLRAICAPCLCSLSVTLSSFLSIPVPAALLGGPAAERVSLLMQRAGPFLQNRSGSNQDFVPGHSPLSVGWRLSRKENRSLELLFLLRQSVE